MRHFFYSLSTGRYRFFSSYTVALFVRPHFYSRFLKNLKLYWKYQKLFYRNYFATKLFYRNYFVILHVEKIMWCSLYMYYYLPFEDILSKVLHRWTSCRKYVSRKVLFGKVTYWIDGRWLSFYFFLSQPHMRDVFIVWVLIRLGNSILPFSSPHFSYISPSQQPCFL